LKQDQSIFLSVGSLSEKKGFSLLIDAVDRLRQRLPNVRLVIIGEGEYRPQLEKQIEDLHLQNNVSLLGALPHENLPHWYAAADVFCLASSREGCPNVVLEAMASGRPVVATKVGGIPELVSSPSLGILVDRNADAFADAMASALAQEWNHNHIAAHASKRGWEQVAANISDLYSKTLNRN
jgi:glycosyltransferase involved in cell wall biosynthesis